MGQQGIHIPKNQINCKMRTRFSIQKSKNVANATQRKNANLEKIVDNLNYLGSDNQSLF